MIVCPLNSQFLVGVVVVINFPHVPDDLAMPLDPVTVESWCLINHCELELYYVCSLRCPFPRNYVIAVMQIHNNLKKCEIFDTVQRLFGCIKYIK